MEHVHNKERKRGRGQEETIPTARVLPRTGTVFHYDKVFGIYRGIL